MASPADRVVRAMTRDGAFRVIAGITTASGAGAALAQELDGERAVRIGELITGAVLIRETTQPLRRVQISWTDPDGRSWVADALPDGKNRGLVSTAIADRPADVLTVDYTLPSGQLHRGTVAVDPGSDFASALMRYLKDSEQILAMVALAALPGPDRVRAAGGFLLQVLPEASPEAIGEMTEHLSDLPPVASLIEGPSATPEDLIATVLHGLDYAVLASSGLEFGCTCSQERVLSSLLTLPDQEVMDMVAGGVLDVRCDACGTRYQIEPVVLSSARARLRGMLPS